MIKVYPDKIIIEMSIEQAKSLRSYLFGSYLRSNDGYYNPIAAEADCGNERSQKAIEVRQTLIGCLDLALTQAVEKHDIKCWNNATRKYL